MENMQPGHLKLDTYSGELKSYEALLKTVLTLVAERRGYLYRHLEITYHYFISSTAVTDEKEMRSRFL